MNRERAIKEAREAIRILDKVEEPTPWCDYVRNALENTVELLEAKEKEAVWNYDTDDEGKARWRCSRCGKTVHRDPADKQYCSRCGARCRKEA